MSVPAAYLGVVLIWATTPLAIQWSSDGVHFLFGVTGRMAIGAVLGLVVMVLSRTAFPFDRSARLTYLVAGLNLFCGMLCTYWGAQFVPSGWVSVLFGLAPLFTGAISALWLRERGLTLVRLLGIGLGLGGLLLLFGNALTLGPRAAWGIGAVLLATLLHSAAIVAIKRLNAEVPGLAVANGAAWVALPLFLLGCGLAGVGLPAAVPVKTAVSILYLGAVGSVLGFTLYYHVLKRVDAMRVALITLLTPVCALLLGRLFNAEPLTPRIALGAAAILFGLLCDLYGSRQARRAVRQGEPG